MASANRQLVFLSKRKIRMARGSYFFDDSHGSYKIGHSKLLEFSCVIHLTLGISRSVASQLCSSHPISLLVPSILTTTSALLLITSIVRPLTIRMARPQYECWS